MTQPQVLNQVVILLETEFGYQHAPRGTLLAKGYEFDSVLIAKDPMPLVILEYKDHVSDASLREFVRKVRSLAWSLFADGKRNMVSAILALGGTISNGQIAAVTRELNGSCRLFVVTSDMSLDMVQRELLPLGKVDFARGKLQKKDAELLLERMASVGPEANKKYLSELVNLIRDIKSPEDIREKVWDAYRKLVKEADDAIEKTEA